MMAFKFVLLVLVVCFVMEARGLREKRAAVTHKQGGIIITSDRGKDIELKPGDGGHVNINGPLFKVANSASHRCHIRNEGTIRYRAGELEVCNGVWYVALGAKLGSRKNPAKSCAAILEDDWSAPSGAYYLQTNPTITKVHCHMENIPGCGGGGWTTIMKTNGYKSTFSYSSAYWKNKVAYHLTGGEAGMDCQETKLPTYWTLPFTRLCLGMSLGGKPKWIRLNYRATSLFSVIADGRYRRFSIGRNTWKSLISGSSQQRNCNREGFNNFISNNAAKVRIGIISNQENDCKSPDSRIGFGGSGKGCGTDDSNSTGNEARCGGDNGDKNIKAYGYILAQ